MRWLVGEHDLSSRVSEVMLRCIWRSIRLVSTLEGGVWARNAHCTTRMSTFNKEELIGASKKGDIARIRQAVAAGVDVRKVVDKYWPNRTLLHHACRYVACETHTLYTLIVHV